MRRRTGSLAVVALMVAASSALATPSWGQGRGDGTRDEDRAAAQVLFDEGQALGAQEKWAEACEKFERSQKLDASVGTQLNLANCFEKVGKTASAWINYHEVAQLSTDRRAGFAQEQAARLEPDLVMLHLRIESPAPGLTVTRGGEDMEEATWNEPVPVDPGTYDIVVSAPGHASWKKRVKLRKAGKTTEVEVPALEALPDPEPGESIDVVEPVAESPDQSQLIAGVVVASLGAVGLGIGVGLAVVGHQKNDESLAFCPNEPNACYADGVALREQAQALQAGYFGAFIAGGAALVTGLVVLATAPSSSTEAAAKITVSPGGFAVVGVF